MVSTPDEIELKKLGSSLEQDEEKEQLLSKETRKRSQYATILQQSNGPDTSTDSIRQRVFRWLQKYVFCCDLGDEDDAMDLHKVYIHTEGWAFTSNRISTTKYNVITFVPKFLFDQFRRYSNLFFLIMALLEQIPGVSPFDTYTIAFPLSIVIVVAAIKEIIEDLRRFKADKEVNNRIVEVLRQDRHVDEIRWKQVKPGDIVRITKDMYFPADLIFLSSSELFGKCYIQTASLDGESNLKIRHAHSLTSGFTEEQLCDLQGFVECELPNKRLYEFTGNLEVNGKSKTSISSDNILLRGAQLKNTDYIHGLVIYTGHDSKILQNTRWVPLKRSHMDHVTNKQILLMFIVIVLLSAVSSICGLLWNVSYSDEHWYLQLKKGPLQTVKHFVLSVITFMILYSSLIPISLIIQLELVKLFQGLFISWDLDMYYEKTDTRAQARNSNLNEELGQVQFIFSDKTGTLTNNIMSFKKCSINGQLYRMDSPGSDDNTDMILSEVLDKGQSSLHSDVIHFLQVLALCHSVVSEMVNGQLCYYAASPDEEALVDAAKRLGVIYESLHDDVITINMLGKREEYRLLNVLSFSSVRRRMSVIVRTPSGEIKLFCKGADVVIFDRLHHQSDNTQTTEQHVTQFSLDGLRTLCIAERTLSERDYELWKAQYLEASLLIGTEMKNARLEYVADLIEKDLLLLGATAVEDKLQDYVPETIDDLHQAGIKVWVLTGDKMETAVNIAFSSRQVTSDMRLILVAETNDVTVKAKLNQELFEIKNNAKQIETAIAIDGKALDYVIVSNEIANLFLELALLCQSVICCRVSPAQKAEMVDLVRRKVKKVTLAIGDGANDVSMIQAANIGVGISGREGLQATLASDYSIAQFQYLSKLLLVHGAWNYQRQTKLVLYSFYKNVSLYMIEFWFAFYNGFSGQPIFEEWTLGLYNLVFTSMPPFVLGLLEQDVRASTRKKHPSLYTKGHIFNTKIFWLWIVLAVIHSLINFYGTIAAIDSRGSPQSNGQTTGLIYIGNVVFTANLITVCLQAGLLSEYWTYYTHTAIWGSLVTWFLFLLPYSHIWPLTIGFGEMMLGQDIALYRSLCFYAVIILLPIIAIMPVIIYKSIKFELFPSAIQHCQQEERSTSSLCSYKKQQQTIDSQ